MKLRRKLYNIYNHINYRCYNANCLNFNRYILNLKEWCRNNGVDPSSAYKCAKGQRKKVNGLTINITQITV